MGRHFVIPVRQTRTCVCGEHGFVPLTMGAVALVDPDMVPRLADQRWSLLRGRGRAYGRAYINGETTLLHRVVSGAGPDQVVDHINGDTLDNRSANIRVCVQAENVRNRIGRKDRTSRFKGIYQCSYGWAATICANGQRTGLGTFPTAGEAARAYDDAAHRLHGEFARTNEMLGLLPPQDNPEGRE